MGVVCGKRHLSDSTRRRQFHDARQRRENLELADGRGITDCGGLESFRRVSVRTRQATLDE